MKKSTFYIVVAIAAEAAAADLLFTGQPDARVAACMIIGFVCLGISEILEALDS